MYGGIGMSASSLHRESTDSLKHTVQESLERVHSLVQHATFENLVDFDNHLDNIEMDWTNPSVGLALEITKDKIQ